MAHRMYDEIARLHGELRFEPVAQRIRVRNGADQVADTTAALLVWEARHVVPSYAVPLGDLDAEVTLDPHEPPDPTQLPTILTPDDPPLHPGPGQLATLRVGDLTLEDIGFVPDDADLGGHVVLSWRPFTWIEEETEVIGHPHDPFKRIDVLASSRHVRVTLDGTVLADSQRPRLLLETHLPPRWYLPMEDVVGQLLEPSDHHTTCAYKGVASYLTLSGHDSGRDLAWYYPDPLHDAEPVRDLVCFWSERTDLELDGIAVPRSESPFASRPS
jgi:uncharacterized protein (DUF427 family)